MSVLKGNRDNDEEYFVCNFCKKSSKEVEVMIAGDRIHICNECTVIAAEIVAKHMYGRIEYESWLK